jgi:hypothetical protein
VIILAALLSLAATLVALAIAECLDVAVAVEILPLLSDPADREQFEADASVESHRRGS